MKEQRACGEALDDGDLCGCERPDPNFDPVEEARDRVRAESVKILFCKEAGSDTYRRKIEANRPEAMMNALAALVREIAGRMGTDAGTILAVLAATMAAPSIRAGKEGAE